MRDWMTLDTEAAITAPSAVHASVVFREPRADDAGGLAQLMLDAYRGTTDDAGETLADAQGEVGKLFAGAYGQLDVGASNLAELEGRLVAATVVTRDATAFATGEAFLAFSMTAPDVKRTGLARAGLNRTIAALRLRGEPRLHLVVTRANLPAVRLYSHTGFVVAHSR